MDCFRCAWNRRKTLFFAADAAGCNKVAFGHHADDAAVTTLMSLMYKGQVETMAPRLSFFEGRFIVIRPLIYLSDADIRRYARAAGWAFPQELACPQEAETRRVKVERFLNSFSRQEREQIRANLWRVAQSTQEER
jgi:tRNA 2-thiocytidine biosynthesis protein TtcA